MSSSKKIRELNRAKTEYDNAKLSAQIAQSNHTMLNISESILARDNEQLRTKVEELERDATQAGLFYEKLLTREQDKVDILKEALKTCKSHTPTNLKGEQITSYYFDHKKVIDALSTCE